MLAMTMATLLLLSVHAELRRITEEDKGFLNRIRPVNVSNNEAICPNDVQ